MQLTDAIPDRKIDSTPKVAVELIKRTYSRTESTSDFVKQTTDKEASNRSPLPDFGKTFFIFFTNNKCKCVGY